MKALAQLRRQDAPREKIIRPCILCNADDGEVRFQFTHPFLTQVLGKSPEQLRVAGWAPEETSSIVRCRRCGANYVRDPFPRSINPDEDEPPESLWDLHDEQAFSSRDETAWVVRSLVYRLESSGHKAVKLLDFGAGSGMESMVARFHVRHVVAYDPRYAGRLDSYRNADHPDIVFTDDRNEAGKQGPFDLVLMNAVIEHVADPKGELRFVFENMTPGGYMFITNPCPAFERELPRLRSAAKVRKGALSQYHPGHVNYLAPRLFETLLKSVGFRITPLLFYAPVPFSLKQVKPWMRRQARVTLRTLQNRFHLPYTRYVYVVQKPPLPGRRVKSATLVNPNGRPTERS